MRMKQYLAGTGLAVAMALGAGAAQATILTLENPGSLIFQQTDNNPCVIGDPSCHNPGGFGQTTIPANTANYDLSSPIYTVAQVRAVVGDTFIVGIDVNTTTSPLATEQLSLFTADIGSTVGVDYTYDGGSPGTQLVNANNGNGFSDELLRTINLTGLLGTDTITFRAVINNATDGREQFFLIHTAAPVPEPASAAVFGVSLLGFGLLRRRRAAKKQAA